MAFLRNVREIVELWLASKMKQQTRNNTNFNVQPGAKGGSDPFA